MGQRRDMWGSTGIYGARTGDVALAGVAAGRGVDAEGGGGDVVAAVAHGDAVTAHQAGEVPHRERPVPVVLYGRLRGAALGVLGGDMGGTV